MSTHYELSGGLEVTRWWNAGSFRWTLHDDTLDVGQIVELYALLDPVVREALLRDVLEREKRGEFPR